MAWTLFAAEQPELINRLVGNPRRVIRELEKRLHGASLSERLRLLGMLASAHHKTGDTPTAHAIIRQGDEISPKLAKPTSHAEFTVYAAALLAQTGRPWDGLARCTAALDALNETVPSETRSKTSWGRRAARHRRLVTANLRTTRAAIYFYNFKNSSAAISDIDEALSLIPSSRRLRKPTRNMLNRARLGAISLLAIALPAGASIPVGLADKLDNCEELFEDEALLTGIHAAQLARCRACLMLRAGDLDAAELLMVEALHWCIDAEAEAEFKQTLEMLCQITGRRGDPIRRQWEATWKEVFISGAGIY